MLDLLGLQPTWHDILYPAVPIVEKIVRPVIVYVFLVVALRIFGKRELAQLNPFDLVVLLSLSNTVQNAIIGDDNSVSGGMLGAFTLLLVNYLVVRFFFRHRRLDQIFEGEPTVLIDDGRMIPKAVAKELLTETEILAAAHKQGFAKLQDINKCILEPGGNFFFEAHTPPEAERRHKEVMTTLAEMQKEIERLRGGSAAPATSA